MSARDVQSRAEIFAPPAQIFVRVGAGVSKHFPARSTEWLLAFVLLLFGFALLSQPGAFATNVGFILIERLFGPWIWGYLCIGIAAGRLSALIINGTFAGTWYSRYSPHVRGTMALLSCFFWFSGTFSMTGTGLAPGLAVYPVFLLFDLYNTRRAFTDARHSDEAAKHGNP